jgi:hypothetical protein
MKKISRYLTTCAILAMCLPAFAQKLSMKKDEFRIDGDAVAKISEKRSENIVNKNFEIANMKDEPMITMTVKTLWNPLSFNHPTWYEVTFVPMNKTVTREVPEGLFGVRKALLEEFVDLNVIGKEGLNEEGVNAYAARHPLDLGARGKIVVDSIGAMTAKSSFIKKRESGKIKVSDNIIKERDEQIGTWEKYGSSTDGRYIIKNMEGGIVGVVTRIKGFSTEVDVILFMNGERHNFSSGDTGITMSDNDKSVIEKFVRFAIDKHNM